MSVASKRGKDFELKVAKMIRSKLKIRVQRDKRSGAGINKSDISDYYSELPLHLEIKDQETIKIKEFFRQAKDSAGTGISPAVVFKADNEVLVCLRFNDLLNFLAEIKDQQKDIEQLRNPQINSIKISHDIVVSGFDMKKHKIFCRSGHIADIHGYCEWKDCIYSRGYKLKKGKK